ncbi:MAG: 50S ribosomal protein L35 [Candidatus Sumerlaeaceae bacterium]|nr:50S ribosomal protein L35 [Candidatus Sumerlaeaceae bacterium]
MPKIKTNSGAAKRFKITANGKVKRGSANRRHILNSKTTKRKRHLRGASFVSKPEAAQVKKLLGYK